MLCPKSTQAGNEHIILPMYHQLVQGKAGEKAGLLPPPSWTTAPQKGLSSTAVEGVQGDEEEEPQSYLLLAAQLLLGSGRSTGCSSSRGLESVDALFPVISISAGTESLVSC